LENLNREFRRRTKTQASFFLAEEAPSRVPREAPNHPRSWVESDRDRRFQPIRHVQDAEVVVPGHPLGDILRRINRLRSPPCAARGNLPSHPVAGEVRDPGRVIGCHRRQSWLPIARRPMLLVKCLCVARIAPLNQNYRASDRFT